FWASGIAAHAAEHPIRAMLAATTCLRSFMTLLLDVPSPFAADRAWEDMADGRLTTRYRNGNSYPLRMIHASTSIDTAKLIQTVGGSSSPNQSIRCSPRPTYARFTQA